MVLIVFFSVENLVHLDPMDRLVVLVNLDLRAHVVLLELREQMDPVVNQDLQVKEVPLDVMDLLDHEDSLDLLGSLVHQEALELLDLLDPLDLAERGENLEQLEHLDLRDNLVSAIPSISTIHPFQMPRKGHLNNLPDFRCLESDAVALRQCVCIMGQMAEAN